MHPELVDEIVRIRRDIHQHPELGFDVERTAGIAAEAMKTLGLTVRTGVGKTGVVADLSSPGATRRIALRADMDALPMDEENEIPYRSQISGRAHMCGHDAHTAMLIGAANLLVAQKDQLPCNVRFLFQPHEEGLPGGAPAMIADGALDGVDEVYALHVWPWLDTGVVGICQGPAMAQADLFRITIEGAGGHAGAPHQTVDPLVIAAQLVTLLQSLVSRTVSPLDSAVLSVTQIHGGTANNVIPARCWISGTVRTYSSQVQQAMAEKMGQLATSVASSFGATAEVDYEIGFPALINAPTACDRACKAASKIADVVYPAEKALFGEDFAYYAEQVPGCFIQLGCRNGSMGAAHPLHHPRFNIDEECLPIGMQVLAGIINQNS